MSPRVGRQTSKVKKTPPLLPPAAGALLVAVALLGAVAYASTSFFSPEPSALLAQAGGCSGKQNASCPGPLGGGAQYEDEKISYKCPVGGQKPSDKDPNKKVLCVMQKPCEQEGVTGVCIEAGCCQATKTREGKSPKLPDGQKPKEEQKKPEEKKPEGGGGSPPQMPQPPKGEEKPKQEQPQQQNQNEQCKLNPDSPECKGVAGAGLTSNELFGASDKDDAASGGEIGNDSALGKFSNWLKSGWDAFTGAGGMGGGDEAEQAGNTAFQTSVSEGTGLTAGGSGGTADDGGADSGGTGVTDTFGDSTFSGGVSNPPSGFWGWIDRIRSLFGF